MSWESECNEIREMKRDDSYNFSYTVRYISGEIGEKGSEDYEFDYTTVDVQLVWFDGDDSDGPGYVVSFTVNDYENIPDEWKGSEEEIYNYEVYSKLCDDLSSAGIEMGAVVGGGVF
jgi:hypothetical protein